jgi:archaellum biogenesis ATPase FlaH
MCPSILVKDCETQKYVAVFTTSEQLSEFLNQEKATGVDVADKYEIYSFKVQEIVDGNEALDIIQERGYLNFDSIYE